MKKWPAIFVCTVTLAIAFSPFACAQGVAQDSKAMAPTGGREYSGMYSFLKDGEFVQITVEDQGRVTGFVSRYGDGANDKGVFLDQYFRSGKLDGNQLSFTTETVHAVWFEFKGMVERGEGKNPGDEAYFVLKGTLTDNASDADKKVTTHSSDVMLKLFPAEASPAAAARN
jgi:hypothetical protein